MNKISTIFGILLVGVSVSTSCGNNGTNKENTDSTSTKTTVATSNNGILTVTAKFVSGGCLEYDADLTFKKEDGSTIDFYRNYSDPKEPRLKFNFIGEDGASANPKWVGQTFVIQYKVNPKGRMSMMSGELEPCNQILSAEKK